jgi:hypothetical protein
MPRRSRTIEVFGSIGTKIRIDGQEYVIQKITEPDHADGLGTVYWTTHCWDCGAAMKVFARPGRIDLSRRCKEHARPGKRAARSP